VSCKALKKLNSKKELKEKEGSFIVFQRQSERRLLPNAVLQIQARRTVRRSLAGSE